MVVERLGRKPQQQVGVGSDATPHVHAAGFSGTLEVAIGAEFRMGHEVGDDLHVHVRGPPPVHGGVTDVGHHLAGLDLLSGGNRGQRSPREVAIEHPEGHAVGGVVPGDDGGAVVVRHCVVDHGLDRAGQHRP